tara:strand:+ start:207 stop:1616 length:1410 start_codon:yes stop_codon:yes gene_type:complete
MASTYTTNLRLTKQGDGENPNSWGQILNDGVISLVDDAIAGYTTVSLGSAATVTLSENQGSGDQSRSAILEFKGSVGGAHNTINVLIPNNSKTYVVKNSVSFNASTDAIVLKVAGNTGTTVTDGSTALYVTNGTTVTPVTQNTFTNLTATSITTGGITTTSLTGVSLATSILAATSITGTAITLTGNVTAANAVISDKVCASAFFGDGSNLTGIASGMPRGYLSGLTLSNNSSDSDHDIDIAVGEARDTADGADLSISSTFTKKIDATWASGSGNGGMANGVSLSADTWYHVYLVELDAGGTDAGFDTATNAANLVATSGVASAYRRIGSVLTDSSSNILGFTQFEDEFIFDTQIVNVNGSALGTSRVLQTVSTPLGFETRAILGLLAKVINSNANVQMTLTHPNVTDAIVSVDIANNAGENSSDLNGTWAAGTHIVRTNTSSQFAFRQSFNSTVYINTNGYLDPRGRG